MPVTVGLACGEKPREANPVETTREAPPDALPHRIFSCAARALEAVIEETDPRVIGFGEFHQQTGTVGTLSTIERFADQLLPLMAQRTSDLVVETWVSEGRCGEVEKQVVSDVNKVSKRPDETEDENLRMLKAARILGVQPHILKMECADYEKVHRADGGVDYLEMLDLVARRLLETTGKILKKRSSEDRRMIAVFSGAIHNDLFPAKDWETFSYGPAMQKAARGRYVEVDIYVPEFVEAASTAREEIWFDKVTSLASRETAALIKMGKNSYIIVFPRGRKAPRSSPDHLTEGEKDKKVAR